MKKLPLYILALLPLLLAFSQVPKLVKTKVHDAITVSLPADFTAVGEQELSAKYVSYRKPLALYTNPSKQADFSVNLSVTQWQHFDLPLVKDFYKASLSTLYSDIQWVKDEIQEIRGTNFALFEYVGTVADTEQENTIKQTKPMQVYTYVAYGLVEGKVVVFTFTAPASQQQQWAPVAQAMVESIRLKKTL
ncbi:hypothetical protein [Cesiribacter andamanensis]|uniref:Uncharacterized protein n=1 Tax=Cesiribacter andamanensis AMV16 TaxID=1279009 RepID=M7NM28_9BACT|nr:hypothetical protein [Cesiribacter andamanensis]EMR02820.1 hypothetical protein ADICEAN_02028 [Cesiribacter andamanensis AMV16]